MYGIICVVPEGTWNHCLASGDCRPRLQFVASLRDWQSVAGGQSSPEGTVESVAGHGSARTRMGKGSPAGTAQTGARLSRTQNNMDSQIRRAWFKNTWHE